LEEKMKTIEENLGNIFERIYNMDGIEIADVVYNVIPDAEILFKGYSVDDYLLLATFSAMLKAGDIRVEILSNTSGKRDYLEKLLSSIEKHEQEQ